MKASKPVIFEATSETKDYKTSFFKTKKIYMELEARKNMDPKSKEVQVLVDKYMHLLSSEHNYNYDAFRELGNIYAKNKNVKAYLNSYGEGFSEFLSKAIKFYCS